MVEMHRDVHAFNELPPSVFFHVRYKSSRNPSNQSIKKFRSFVDCDFLE